MGFLEERDLCECFDRLKKKKPGVFESKVFIVSGDVLELGLGIMRTIHTKPDIICDFIPVDVCAKNIIAGAWIRGTKPYPCEFTQSTDEYVGFIGDMVESAERARQWRLG
ncbi:hypothetical protein HF086_011009 [Spodoptera exigua]|uniref:Uncharacterized protein n=1 Tax=Spodoptera exigua TaxID=7107 RepID=A0A922MUG7_SPOEX|nr:hypothetical protein HF086_011009 [Spodoptera exigua]